MMTSCPIAANWSSVRVRRVTTPSILGRNTSVTIAIRTRLGAFGQSCFCVLKLCFLLRNACLLRLGPQRLRGKLGAIHAVSVPACDFFDCLLAPCGLGGGL